MLGALGNIPESPNNKMNQADAQQAHQSSFFHKDDQSILP